MNLFRKNLRGVLTSVLVAYQTLCFEVFATKTIYIYNDAGVGEDALIHTKYTLKTLAGYNYRIKEINAATVIDGQWDKDATLFVMPGGRDALYDKLLRPLGNQRIKSYINLGGSFLAICGAAYYGGTQMVFAKGIVTPDGKSFEVSGSRELAFFPGEVRGPALGGIRLYKTGTNGYDINPTGYDYTTYSGARVTSLQISCDDFFEKGKVFKTFYNGGPQFIGAELFSDTVSVIASYQDEVEKESAIIECRVGKGKAILCGVHPEFDPFMLNGKNKYLQGLLPELWKTDNDRKQLMMHLLNRLGIETHEQKAAKL